MDQPNFIRASINQEQIAKIMELKRTQQQLKDELAQIEKAIAQEESDLMEALEFGADTSNCGYKIELRTYQRRYPSWRDEFIARLGREAAVTFYKATEPRTYRKLVIQGS